MSKFWFVILFISGLILSLSTAGSILYGLYQWCSVGLEFKEALWIAAKTWMTVGGLSLLSVIVSGISIALSKDFH